MNRNTTANRSDEMYRAILELKDLEECKLFFEDLCAMTELRSIEQRFEVAKMLREENVYTEIMQKTGASSATISRVNRMLQYGNGSMRRILGRMAEKEAPQKEE